MPYQLLKPTIRRFAFDKVHIASARERSLLADLNGLDTDVFKAALLPDQKDNRHHNNVIRTVATLSAVDHSDLKRFGALEDDTCPFCGTDASSTHHCIWKCSHPELIQARNDTDDPMQKLLVEHVDILPTSLQLGIPSKLALLPCGPWWSNDTIQS
eukprot:8828776-Karenia_brevis.AAC.1